MDLRIAIVYDWIDKWGGVERVLLTLHKLLPDAIFYTSYYDEKKAPWAKKLNIKTSFIQKLPQFIRRSRIASIPFYPFAFESFDFSEFDVVISVTSSFAKGIITRPGTMHICYLLTPPRFLWHHKSLYVTSGVTFYTNYLEKWDYIAAQRPDKIISISKTVRERAKKIYNRDSEVIYPPFDLEYWDKIKIQLDTRHPEFISGSRFWTSQNDNEMPKRVRHDMPTNYFLLVSRLEPYKKVELVFQLFNQLKQKSLVVIGDGTQYDSLKKIAGKNITMIKKVTDEELAVLYTNAHALLMPQEEDFGYVALEAQFFGCPVIAYKKGGATESVIEGKTGIFFEEQTVTALEKAIHKYDKMKQTLKKSTRDVGVKNVEQFSKERFERKFRSLKTNSND